MVAIYAITCSETGFVYVGCTKHKLSKRHTQHMGLLKQRKHTAPKMVDDFFKFGRKSFSVSRLEELGETVSIIEKREAELKWMRHYDGLGLLYNATESSFGTHAGPGRRWTPEANELRRQAQLGKPKGQGAKISATKRALGQGFNEEARRNSVASRKRMALERKLMKEEIVWTAREHEGAEA